MHFYLATEDAISETLAKCIVSYSNPELELAAAMGRRGFGYLKSKVEELCQLARNFPVLMVTDLDHRACAPALLDEWTLGIQVPDLFMLRVAVRESESWLMADRIGFARFIGAPVSQIPRNPDEIADPKNHLLRLAQRYAPKDLKYDLLPRPGVRALVGPGYNQVLSRFALDSWRVENARQTSPSLDRMIERLRRIEA